MLSPLRDAPMMRAVTARLGVNIRSLKAYDVRIAELSGKATLHNLLAEIPSFSMKRLEWILLPSSAAFAAVGPTIAIPRARN